MESQQSDYMLYTNIADVQFAHKRANDLSFIYQMSRPAPRCMMNRDIESKFQIKGYRTMCNPCTERRGGNAVACGSDRSCPHPEYSRFYMNEFLMVPCPHPTHKNSIVCSEDSCCSKRHQLFKNITKRKDITSK